MKVGIELKMRDDDVKTFYNIGSEKEWISSAMEENQLKGKMTVCLLLYNCLATAQSFQNDYLRITLCDFIFLLFHKGQNKPIIEWTIVHLLRFSEVCDIRYFELSAEELEFKSKNIPDEGLKTFAKYAKQCRNLYDACKKNIFGKSSNSRRKAIATYPELEGCPPDCRNSDCFQDGVVNTRGNKSPRMSKNVPFWPMLITVLCSK